MGDWERERERASESEATRRGGAARGDGVRTFGAEPSSRRGSGGGDAAKRDAT